MSSPPETPDARPIHVAMLPDERFVEQARALLARLCVGMVDQAIQISMVTPIPLPDELLVGPARVVMYRRRRWPFESWAVRTVTQELASRRPTVVHALSGRTARLARGLAAHFAAPLVVQVNGFDEIASALRGRPVAPAAVVCVSEPLRKAVERHRRRRLAGRVELIRPGVHAQAEPSCLADPTKIPTVLTQVRSAVRWRTADVIRAAARLKAQGVELMLFVLGGGPTEPALRALTKSLGLQHHVTFAGHLAEPASAFRSADIFVLPGVERTFSMTTLEALAAGMAVVGVGGGASDVLIDRQTALLYEQGRLEQLVERLQHLLQDRRFARELATRALEHIRQNHQTSVMIASLGRLYRDLTANRSAAGGQPARP